MFQPSIYRIEKRHSLKMRDMDNISTTTMLFYSQMPPKPDLGNILGGSGVGIHSRGSLSPIIVVQWNMSGFEE